MDSLRHEIFRELTERGLSRPSLPKCKLCSGETMLFDAVDFNKHCSGYPYVFGLSGVVVPYFRCPNCLFIFTNLIDDWQIDEVMQFIYNDEYIKVDPDYHGGRARKTAVEMRSRLAGCERLRILDYGSGSGIFAEEMRLCGFERVESYDPLSSPNRPVGEFDLITCFEVIEHSPQPLTTMVAMRNMLAIGGAIIVGQSLQPRNIDEIGARWWYIAPRNGHVSIFADQTFLVLSTLAALTYYRGKGYYVFAKGELSEPLRGVVGRIGPRYQLQTLSAPPGEILDQAWHGIERTAGLTYRWSATNRIRWADVALRPGTTIIQIWYVMEISEGFASQCTISVGDHVVPTRIEGQKIIGEVNNKGPVIRDIVLSTPATIIPGNTYHTNDSRTLGLAVVCD